MAFNFSQIPQEWLNQFTGGMSWDEYANRFVGTGQYGAGRQGAEGYALHQWGGGGAPDQNYLDSIGLIKTDNGMLYDSDRLRASGFEYKPYGGNSADWVNSQGYTPYETAIMAGWKQPTPQQTPSLPQLQVQQSAPQPAPEVPSTPQPTGFGDIRGQITGGARSSDGSMWNFHDQGGNTLTSMPLQDFYANHVNPNGGMMNLGSTFQGVPVWNPTPAPQQAMTGGSAQPNPFQFSGYGSNPYGGLLQQTSGSAPSTTGVASPQAPAAGTGGVVGNAPNPFAFSDFFKRYWEQ